MVRIESLLATTQSLKKSTIFKSILNIASSIIHDMNISTKLYNNSTKIKGFIQISKFWVIIFFIPSNYIQIYILCTQLSKSQTTCSGLCLKNFKTPFFLRYQKFPSWGNSNGSKTTPKFFLTNMVARGVQSFCILEGATDLLIE